MILTLNITEDSKVELVKDGCEAVQGEHNVTVLNVNFPSTIKGYSIDNYTKQIEFGECKELGECKKFFDVLDGNTYKLCSTCTQFEKLMIQFTLKNLVDEAEPIVWKTIPFALEFCESINAENTKEVQATLLSLAEIKTEWENYIKNNTFRVINSVGDMPTADAASLGNTMFYLGANSTSPYTLTYGHYYRCNNANGAYEWTDLTQDPSLEGVANGIREINHNQTMQEWVGTKEELANEVIQPNVKYTPIDLDIKETFDKVLSEMSEDENYNLAYPIKNKNNALEYDEGIIQRKKLLWSGAATPSRAKVEVGGMLSSDSSVGLATYEFYPLNSGLTTGHTFVYNGEVVEVGEYSEDGFYRIVVKYGGEVASQSGSSAAMYVFFLKEGAPIALSEELGIGDKFIITGKRNMQVSSAEYVDTIFEFCLIVNGIGIKNCYATCLNNILFDEYSTGDTTYRAKVWTISANEIMPFGLQDNTQANDDLASSVTFDKIYKVIE